ncbi:MAG: gas vesicle synthesis protein GvpA [Candidatus Bathyarchaeota archaeon BA2]|nr:MAG: gas vesicle synthesis protein GvpA [Candidatus Bathyarchaeota archaeon BA2]
MEPTRNSALVDLIDRILVKGVILQADLVISVSEVPLIGVNLKAAIAGMTTMLDYGMMEPWDEKIRRYALEHSDEEELPLDNNEKIVLKTFGSHYYRDTSLPGVWRQGYLYLTNKRLFLFRKKPAKILFEVPLEKIRGLTIERKKYLKEKEETLLLLIENERTDSDVAVLHTLEIRELKRRIEERIEKIHRTVKVLPSTYLGSQHKLRRKSSTGFYKM